MSFKLAKNISNFGLGYTIKKIYNTLMFKITKKQKFRERIFDLNLNYLNKHYGSCFVNQEKEEHIPENFNIYVFWWQGINESTPELVKTCIHLAQVNNPNNKVIILTKDNFKDYSDIPDYILEKLDKGIITITHFSDILRASVLSKTGGGGWTLPFYAPLRWAI